MRGRFHPVDGQLYALRHVRLGRQPRTARRASTACAPPGKPSTSRSASTPARIGSSSPSAARSIARPPRIPSRFSVSTWTLRRSANYGSKHHDERTLKVDAASLSADGRTVSLRIPGLGPTQCMEIVYDLKGSAGEPVGGRAAQHDPSPGRLIPAAPGELGRRDAPSSPKTPSMNSPLAPGPATASGRLRVWMLAKELASFGPTTPRAIRPTRDPMPSRRSVASRRVTPTVLEAAASAGQSVDVLHQRRSVGGSGATFIRRSSRRGSPAR